MLVTANLQYQANVMKPQLQKVQKLQMPEYKAKKREGA